MLCGDKTYGRRIYISAVYRHSRLRSPSRGRQHRMGTVQDHTLPQAPTGAATPANLQSGSRERPAPVTDVTYRGGVIGE